jgi:hypothetical protein
VYVSLKPYSFARVLEFRGAGGLEGGHVVASHAAANFIGLGQIT